MLHLPQVKMYQCRKCKESFLRTSEFFHKMKLSSDGLRHWCKACVRKYNLIYKKKNPNFNKDYYLKNKEAEKIRYKKWIAVSREKRREYDRKLYKKSIEHKIKKNMGTLVLYHLKVNNLNSDGKLFSLFGYTVKELMNDIQSKFKDGMSWDNHGEWHIDHKRPISSFGIKSLDDPMIRECWSLLNLQPLWAIDNISKGNRWYQNGNYLRGCNGQDKNQN